MTSDVNRDTLAAVSPEIHRAMTSRQTPGVLLSCSVILVLLCAGMVRPRGGSRNREELSLMRFCKVFKLALAFVLLVVLGSVQAQEQAAGAKNGNANSAAKKAPANGGDNAAQAGGQTSDSGSGTKSSTKKSAADGAGDSGDSTQCTVRPDDIAGGSGDKGKSKGQDDSSSGSPSVQVNQYAAGSGAPQSTKGGGKGGDDSTSKSKNIVFFSIKLDRGKTNAVEIAAKLPDLSKSVISANALSPTEILVLLDSTQANPTNAANNAKADASKNANKNANKDQAKDANNNASKDANKSAANAKGAGNAAPAAAAATPQKHGKPKPGDVSVIEAQITEYVKDLEAPNPEVFVVTLKAGTGKACDVAHALVNAFPGVKEITAIDDSRMFVTADAEFPGFERKKIEELAEKLAAPAKPAQPRVESRIQRLYYIHDPAAVAALVNEAFPNVSAQAMSPDRVMISDSDDTDDDAAGNAVTSAQRVIAQLDQPHPQVQVDAWSMQLATTQNKPDDNLGKTVNEMEDLAAEFNGRLALSLKNGFEVLAGKLSNPANLDQLMREYITSSTHLCKANNMLQVQRWERPYKGDSCTAVDPNNGGAAGKSAGYGLGYTTLYYPMSPNLIDMMVTLVSMNDPQSTTDEVINAMEERTEPRDMKKPCRKRDGSVYEDKHDGPKPFQMECVYDALMFGMFASQKSATGTSALGQMRAALVDFLYQYKRMIYYPNEFDPYEEPLAADTLDSAFAPMVDAFNDDMSVFQNELQVQCAKKLGEKKNLTYGYGGVVSVKVLGEETGTVDTATQNFFDATPAVTLNDVLSNLQTEGASVKKSPLSSLVTSLAPAKAVELMTGLGMAFSPKATTAELGRGLDLTVTAHTLSGAYGADLDLDLKSTENGAGLSQEGSSKKTDDLNSRVSQHTVNTKVRVNSMKLFKISTLGSVLARGRKPWELVDPVEIPLLGPLVKVPRKPAEVYTQSLVFVDAIVVPTAADLGFGVPIQPDLIEPALIERGWSEGRHARERSKPRAMRKGASVEFEAIESFDEMPDGLGSKIEQYHGRIVDCLNREYVGSDGTVKVSLGYGDTTAKPEAKPATACYFEVSDLGAFDSVE